MTDESVHLGNSYMSLPNTDHVTNPNHSGIASEKAAPPAIQAQIHSEESKPHSNFHRLKQELEQLHLQSLKKVSDQTRAAPQSTRNIPLDNLGFSHVGFCQTPIKPNQALLNQQRL
jgi:hypothetical protein